MKCRTHLHNIIISACAHYSKTANKSTNCLYSCKSQLQTNYGIAISLSSTSRTVFSVKQYVHLQWTEDTTRTNFVIYTVHEEDQIFHAKISGSLCENDDCLVATQEDLEDKEEHGQSMKIMFNTWSSHFM